VTVNLPNKEAWNQREVLRNNLAQHAGIKELSITMGAPGQFNIRMGSNSDSLAPENKIDSEDPIIFAPAVVDYDFLDLLDINLIAGRNFSRDRVTDTERAYIINEKGADMLGWTPEEAVGNTFGSSGGEVIGVVENFHISSLHNDIEGVYLQIDQSASFYSGGILLAKLAADQISSSLDIIKSEVTKFSPNTNFSYEFLDDKFDAMYRTEIRFGKIVGWFTLIAIIIACLGLYGLAAFSAERRIKEIGIRKVLGATVSNIVALLSKDFIKLVVIGFVIAIPIAWYSMNQWLADFAYRIDIGPGIFVLAGGAAILIALFTVSWQSIRAAVANPVDSLRSE
jgi:putative ABC transport system permease protein